MNWELVFAYTALPIGLGSMGFAIYLWLRLRKNKGPIGYK